MTVSSSGSLGVVRCAATGAATLALLLLLCWLGAQIADLRASHMFIALFTPEPLNSLAALGAGLLWSVVFGGLTGAVVAGFYGAFAKLGARR